MSTELPKTGSRVGVVDGPGQFPQDRTGTVLCHVTDRWGTHAVVLMDDGKIKTCHYVVNVGIGFHQL